MDEKPLYLIVDLDETLAKVNTFRRWTIQAFLKPNITTKNYLASLMIFVMLYALRLFKFLKHEDLKHLFVAFWGLRHKQVDFELMSSFNQRFAEDIVKRFVNTEVLAKLEDIQKQYESQIISAPILATAAPAYYATLIAEHFNYSYIASAVTDTDLAHNYLHPWQETRHEKKSEAVFNVIADAEFILFTDHHDDWPLMCKAKALVLVKPKPSLLKKVKSLNIPVSVL